MESTYDCLGCFPVMFASRYHRTVLGLQKHKISRHGKQEDVEEDIVELPTAMDYFRAGHTLDIEQIGTSQDTRSLLFGGYNSPNELYVMHNSERLLQPDCSESVSWERVKLNNIKGRSGHISTIYNNKLYIYGGYNDSSQVYSDMFYIDLATDTFETKPVPYKSIATHNLDRRWHAGVSVTDDKKWLINGGWNASGVVGDTILFNFETNKWEELKIDSAPPSRRWHTLTELKHKNQYLIYGGYTGDLDNPLSDFHILDLHKQKWIKPQMKGELPGPRYRHSISQLNKNSTKEYFVLGGYALGQRTCRDIYILHTDDMSWTKVKDSGSLYPAIRVNHKIVSLGDYGFLVAGGVCSDFIEPFYFFDSRLLQ